MLRVMERIKVDLDGSISTTGTRTCSVTHWQSGTAGSLQHGVDTAPKEDPASARNTDGVRRLIPSSCGNTEIFRDSSLISTSVHMVLTANFRGKAAGTSPPEDRSQGFRHRRTENTGNW